MDQEIRGNSKKLTIYPVRMCRFHRNRGKLSLISVSTDHCACVSYISSQRRHRIRWNRIKCSHYCRIILQTLNKVSSEHTVTLFHITVVQVCCLSNSLRLSHTDSGSYTSLQHIHRAHRRLYSLWHVQRARETKPTKWQQRVFRCIQSHHRCIVTHSQRAFLALAALSRTFLTDTDTQAFARTQTDRQLCARAIHKCTRVESVLRHWAEAWFNVSIGNRL